MMVGDQPLVIAGREIRNRFFLGTGKFQSKEMMRETIQAAKIEVVTVALRRIDLHSPTPENILDFIPAGTVLMTNTSGARTAAEAVRLARLSREAGCGNWIKIEVINDSRYLLPDNLETLKATEQLAADGFVVFPYMYPDLYFARAMAKAGAAAVMPLGSLIGSHQGLKTREFIRIILAEIDTPVIVDAGIGTPSQALEAMEMGAAAVLANTAVAEAGDPPGLACAFTQAVAAGRLARLSSPPQPRDLASPSSPLTGFLYSSHDPG